MALDASALTSVMEPHHPRRWRRERQQNGTEIVPLGHVQHLRIDRFSIPQPSVDVFLLHDVHGTNERLAGWLPGATRHRVLLRMRWC